ncbi:MAG: winged helix-turn-helix transcriptional regulator [Lentisphaeria bacterium]|nr:winged helix-turn-helix transcriptional regulator [Lentisphaeria bacterium]
MIKQKHQQLFDILMQQFNSGRWGNGARLPSIRDLAREYGVSINVVSRAVEMLKEAGMVSVRAGEGVFSTVSGSAVSQAVRYSANRLFGQYASAKRLRVLVEDSTARQLAFWNRFFESTAVRHRDLDIEITYGGCGEGPFDVAFGGLNFLKFHGFDPARTLSVAEQRIFAPRLYDGIPLTPEHCSLGAHRNYFPYGLVTYCLVSRDPLPTPVRGEGILDYIERLAAADPRKKVGYALSSGLELLVNSGVFFFDGESGAFRMPDPALLRSVFERTAALYKAGHLLWEHGATRDESSLAAITEVTFFKAHSFREEQEITPRPEGKLFLPVIDAAAISSKTLFPEECFRLISSLLACDSQTRAETEHIFNAVRPVSPKRVIGGAHPDIPPGFCNLRGAGFQLELQYFVTWEFFHYITGQCDFSPGRLEAKIRWYLDRMAERRGSPEPPGRGTDRAVRR